MSIGRKRKKRKEAAPEADYIPEETPETPSAEEMPKESEEDPKKRHIVLAILSHLRLRHIIILILVIVAIVIAIAEAIGNIGKDEVPNVEDMNADEAVATLNDAGFDNVSLQTKKGDSIDSNAYWIVSSQSPAAEEKAGSDEEIVLTCQTEEAIAAEKKKDKLSDKLSASSAWVAVEEYGKSQYSYGFDLHYIVGKIAEEMYDEDTWYLKASCDVTNAYGAEASRTCEALVSGTEDNPKVTSFTVY